MIERIINPVVDITPECCRNCSNNPRNNPLASGFCHCVMPYMQPYSPFGVNSKDIKTIPTITWDIPENATKIFTCSTLKINIGEL